MKILAIESSCDETAAAVVEDGRKVLSSVIASQVKEHIVYGGVVPEIASRMHTQAISGVVAKALEDAGVTYADLDAEEEMKAFYMGINGYFNLLPDATPNYCNADSTLTRLEFMSMVTRAETPVQELEADTTFATTVGNNELNIYAQEVAESSYLDIESKSLNNMTANGTITRGEAIYMIMKQYFPEELANVDLSTTNYQMLKMVVILQKHRNL